MQKPPSNQKKVNSETFTQNNFFQSQQQQQQYSKSGQKLKIQTLQSPHQSNKNSQLSLQQLHQQQIEEGFITEKQTLKSSTNDEKSLTKILSNQPTYRIAQPSRNNINVSTKFWNDTNQNNKGLIKLNSESTRNRPQTGQPQGVNNMNRAVSLPKFYNEKLKSNNKTIDMENYSMKQDNYQYSDVQSDGEIQEGTLENAAQALNSKLAFQKAIMSHTQPYQFLSSVGGKKTNLNKQDSKSSLKGYNSINSESNNIPIQQLTPYETLNMYKKIDIDKNMIPQIMISNKSNKRPHTVSTVTKMSIVSIINQVKDQQASSMQQQHHHHQKQLSQQIQYQSSQPNTANKERDIQTATDQKRNKKDFAIKKPQSAIQQKQAQMSAQNKTLQKQQSPTSGKQSISSGKKAMLKKISDRNQEILNEMDQADNELGIIEDFDDDAGLFYEKAEQIKQYKKQQQRPVSSLIGKRPISAVSVGPNQFFQNFSKYTSFNALEIPYETLFDRNERTLCATFAKFGDLNYYSPVQRIGAYMQYGAKLKLDHLLEIISLQQTITTVERNEFEIPIQLAIIDDLNPFQRKNKTGISTTFNPKDLYREPVTLSLFPEYFESEDENLSVAQCAERYFQQMLLEMGGVYDPEYLGKSNYAHIDPAVWPEETQKKIGSSVTRYEHYLASDLIKQDEIPKFNKEWMSNALELIDPELLKNEELYRQVFQEIFENFKFSMKKAMLDYILRSPMERARLHIVLLPRPVLCSAQRISREGGFNIHLFNEWHQYVEQGREKCKSNLVLMNIINSSLQNWYCDFDNFKLMEFESLKKISSLGYTLSIQNFIKQQNIYRQNVTTIMRFIWHRGALLIIKKFKFLRRPSIKPGKWTFCGFKNTNWKKYKEQEEIRIKQQQQQKKQQKQKSNIDKIDEEQEDEYDENNESVQEDSRAGTPRSLVFLRELNEHFQSEKKSHKIQNFSDAHQDFSLPADQVYQTMLQYLIEREFEDENHAQFDFYQDLNFDDLIDIRQNSAYMKIAQKTMEDESVWKQENGWSLYTKEYKQRILDNVGVLMGLQLRSMIEKTFESAESFFLQYLTLQQMQDQNISIFKREDEEESELMKDQIYFSNIKDPDLSGHSKSKSQNQSNVQNVKDSKQSSNQIHRQNSSFQNQNSGQVNQIQNSQQSQQQNKQNNQSQNMLQGLNKKDQSQQPQLQSQQLPQQQISRNSLDEQEKSLLQQVPKTMTKIEYRKPEMIDLIQNQFFPILNLEMIISEEHLKFKETPEFIKTEISNYLRSLVMTFNHIMHPKILKVNVDKNYNPLTQMEFSRQQQKKQKHALENIIDSELNYIDEFDDFYRKFAPQFYVTEKQNKNELQNQEIENKQPEQQQSQNQQQQNQSQQQIQEDKGGSGGSQNDITNRLMTGLSGVDSTKKKYLQVVTPGEKCFLNIENRIISHLIKHYEESSISFQVFDQFRSFITKQADKELKQIYAKKQNITNDEFRNYYELLTKFLDLLYVIPDHVYMPLFDVNCTTVKQELKKTITDLRKKLVTTYEESLVLSLRTITEAYNKISSTIRKSTNTAEEVEFMEKYIQVLIGEKTRMKHQSTTSFQRVCFLMKMNIDLGETITDLSRDVFQWPDKLDQELMDAEEKHSMERQRLEERLKEKWFNFNVRAQVHKEELEEFENFSEYSLCSKYVKQVEDFEKILQADKELMEEIMDQEKKLYGYCSNFDKFSKLMKDFSPIALLWKSVSQFIENKKKWTLGPIQDLDSGEVENNIKEFTKVTTRLIGVLPGASIGLRVATKFREEVMEVNKLLPAIEMVSRPGIKDRHWENIASILEIPNINAKDVNLNKLLNFNMIANLQKIEQVAESASKEYTLENALDRMEKDWENLSFVIINYKNRGIKVLQGSCVEDIQILLDDHTIKSQTIRQNPNVKFMEQRAIKWEELMLYIQAVTDVWIKVQSQFLYLEPIFSFDDISKTLGNESKKFQIVHDTWTMIMDYVDDDPKILHIDRVPNILKELDHCQELIDEIQKGLEEHLENKRLEFPRFFFLSNDDLLTILAETRDPLLVQPHMKKCFEGINELIFNNNSDIIGMKSLEKEEITFIERIQVRSFKSNVEKWLLKVEDQMIVSITKIMEDSLLDLRSNREKKNDWVRRWPGQVILAINQLTWTEYAEEKIFKEGTNGLVRFHKEIQSNIEKIVQLVRGTLTLMETLTLGALIVLEVHNIDVIKTMIDDKISDVTSFEWLAQMRYYWIQENGKIQVKMMSTCLNYGYEYLGNSPRLVITPLTDRCYRTLMSALQLNLGGAPEGPAGTGKTESTKDLAKAIAIQCVVFNCSDGLKIDAMAKFFKGLIAAGAWSCFDEFNRIDLEVLSVIAQQIRQIQDAKALQKTTIIFHGTELTIQYSCNIFITMNPGYAGRSELPDNLKTLFRPVAMMIPDYAMIAEISLYSYGFVYARDQARKIVAVYKLCSEQLSSQDHYDYGMRAVKAVLTTASQIKRKFANEKEEILILRSICDVNLPKFLSQDIQLFQGIISDLFPNVKMPNPEYANLNQAISMVFNERSLQNVNNFRKKIFQLYEVLNTRHGVMIVGQPFSGKTECYKVLSSAMTLARKQGDPNEYPTYYYIINPKAISLNQLYGFADNVSKEWTEGILAEVYRKCATNRAMERQIIVFDGPVDADWIENLNTVLDDNKKLCLMNGETIAMTQYMTMLFEVQDLKQASPATVSRCGMVYMQPDQLGWNPLFQSWLQSIAPKLDENMVNHIDELFDAFVNNILQYTQNKCKEHQHVPESGKVVSLMRLYKKLLQDYNMFDRFYVEKYKPEQLIVKLDMIFLYACMWTLAGSFDETGRDLFHKYFKNLMREALKCQNKKDKVIRLDKQAIIPEGSQKMLVYDYFIDHSEFRWKTWKEQVEQTDQTILEHQTFNQITINTVEMLRITDLLQRSVQDQYPLLLMGPTGVGKSTYVNKFIKGLQLNLYNIISISFSAQTSSEKTQEIIDNRLDKRRKGIYGPKLGVKCIVFIDDTNMPAYDKYEAQPPIELLRQFLDHKGWYGKDRKMRELVDTLLIAAMSPPGGGRNFITPRFLRHFSVVSTVDNSDEQLVRIFGKLMTLHLRGNDFPKQFHERYMQCVNASVQLYQLVCKNLKPTPSKSHYQFNQRDLSRCIKGLMLLNQQQLKDTKDDKLADMKIIRLWVHESCRVFFDRLVFEQDNNLFYNDLLLVMRQEFREDIKMVMKTAYDHVKINLNTYEPLKVIRFGELLGEIDERDRPYQEITVLDKIYPKLEYFNEDFNTNSKKPMNLIFFEFALDNILKICRLLKMNQSHALLIGLGGSGRQSMALLAAHIRELPLFQIESNKNYNKENWMEDMQKVMIQAGSEHREIVFLMSDAQIKQSFILEDINNMLNNGDIPQIFPMEEFSLQIEKLRSHAKKLGMMQLYESGSAAQYYDFFVDCVKQKLHIIIALSSVGTTLRNKIRNFPNIINCTTCIWFKEWPEEALQAVAMKVTTDLSLETHVQRKIVQICKKMHSTALDLASYYQRLENKINYITPSSYLELMYNLSTILQSQRKKLEERRNVYKNGVQQILKTQEYVKQMEISLNEKQPVLVTMNEQTTKIAEEIQGQAKSMEPKKKQVEQEEILVNERVMEAEKIKEDCEKDLSVAKPKLIKAMKALDTLDPNDINNLKAMLQPPLTVKLVLESICIMCKIPPEKVPNPKYPKERILDYWEASKKFMNQKNFLQTLKDFDKDNIDPQIMQRIRQNYISQTKDFNPTRVEKASSAAKGMCEWILAMDEYEKVLTIVKPKQQRYNESKADVEMLQASLQKTREELNQLNKQIQFLENQYESYRLKQKQLQDEIIDCEKKLKRAANLITSLGGEQERWRVTAIDLDQKLEMCIGDVTVSTGIISYLGPFTQIYRNKIIKDWVEYAKSLNIQVRDNFSLMGTLGEAITIRKWTMNGLPSDSFSIDNGIITYNTKRWPLMIDPQKQAFKWIKPNEEYDGYKVVIGKQSDSSFQRTLENAIQFGQVLILENTKEDIDSLLEPVLQKQTFKSGGVLSIKIGDNIIDYGKTFKLYFTCKLRNPHFTPEISTRLTILNFTITKEGLDDQLLELCVRKEVPEDAELKSKLIVQSHENKKQLDEIEQKILDVLNKAESILDDEKAVNILQSSKVLSLEIEEKQRYAEETEHRIEISRQNYKPIAAHSTILFFVVTDMAQQNVMYQYSLDWFISLYLESFDKAKKTQELFERIKNVNDYFRMQLFNNVCRSLYEKDKLLFSFLLLIRLLEQKSYLDNDEFKFFISPISVDLEAGKNETQKTLNTEEYDIQSNQCSNWLPNPIWEKLCVLQRLSHKFSKILDSFKDNSEEWKSIYFAQNAYEIKFPVPYQSISQMQRLCILKIFRPDKVVRAISEFIKEELGDRFMNPLPFNLSSSYNDSNPAQPLVFILPGTDPMATLNAFADQKNKFLKAISLGMGQGVHAEKAIEEAKSTGSWVILQNCHLAPSWMPKLERLVEELQLQYIAQNSKNNDTQKKDKMLHTGFRLWLTTYSSTDFPNTILENSIKMTNEPPKGLKSNMIVSYTNDLISDPAFFEDHSKPQQFKSLLYGLCLFHAVIQERRNFGSLGWNIQYDFNQSDLRISARQLHIFLNEYENIPYKALHYLIGECNYGGRVTDDKDRRILHALMQDFFSEKVFTENFNFAGDPQYTVPKTGNFEYYIKFINEIPSVQQAQMFGFNENGDIVKEMKSTNEICDSMLQIWSSSAKVTGDSKDNMDDALSASDKSDKTLTLICDELIKKIPKKFDISIAEAKYPLDYKNSMNAVLLQEIGRYNNLVNIITKNLKDIILALQGIVVMSAQLEMSSQSIIKGLVPDLWKKNSYPTLKTLSGYVSDLVRRLKHYHQWIDTKPPSIHWISGFYFTQSFLTAILQNQARKYQIPIDTLIFNFKFQQEPELDSLEDQAALIDINEGSLMYGLFIEGSQWDYQNHILIESQPKILYSTSPIIWLKPVEIQNSKEPQHYKCPVYKTQERKGILSTTGHSTNFIMNISLPTNQQESHWVKRGVALICSLSD